MVISKDHEKREAPDTYPVEHQTRNGSKDGATKANQAQPVSIFYIGRLPAAHSIYYSFDYRAVNKERDLQIGKRRMSFRCEWECDTFLRFRLVR